MRLAVRFIVARLWKAIWHRLRTNHSNLNEKRSKSLDLRYIGINRMLYTRRMYPESGSTKSSFVKMRQETGGISVRSSPAGRTINWMRSRCASLRKLRRSISTHYPYQRGLNGREAGVHDINWKWLIFNVVKCSGGRR